MAALMMTKKRVGGILSLYCLCVLYPHAIFNVFLSLLASTCREQIEYTFLRMTLIRDSGILYLAITLYMILWLTESKALVRLMKSMYISRLWCLLIARMAQREWSAS